MAADRASSQPTGGHGLLRAQRTRSYGSLVNSSVSPIRQRRIQHQVQPGETLQGLSLKYGVSMEQIKRANRLYTNDSIFLKTALCIPLLAQSVSFTHGVELGEEDLCPEESPAPHQPSQSRPWCGEGGGLGGTDLSPKDYLQRMDGLIHRSKEAAVKTCEEGEKQLAMMEQLCSPSQAGRSSTLPPGVQNRLGPSAQQPMLGAVPLTITKRTRVLRDREDQIFEL